MYRVTICSSPLLQANLLLNCTPRNIIFGRVQLLQNRICFPNRPDTLLWGRKRRNKRHHSERVLPQSLLCTDLKWIVVTISTKKSFDGGLIWYTLILLVWWRDGGFSERKYQHFLSPSGSVQESQNWILWT